MTIPSSSSRRRIDTLDNLLWGSSRSTEKVSSSTRKESGEPIAENAFMEGRRRKGKLPAKNQSDTRPKLTLGSNAPGSSRPTPVKTTREGIAVLNPLPPLPSTSESTNSWAAGDGSTSPVGESSGVTETEESTTIDLSSETTRSTDVEQSASAQPTGPGGCCRVFLSLLKSIPVQAISTAVTYGLKPFAEAIATEACLAAGASAATAKTVSLVTGGFFVGSVHTALGGITSTLLNTALEQDSVNQSEELKEGTGWKNELARHGFEVLTIDLPVYVAFDAAYAGLGALRPADAGLWHRAAATCLTSTAAGAVQGLMTRAIQESLAACTTTYEVGSAPQRPLLAESQQEGESVFESSDEPPRQEWGEYFRDTFSAKWKGLFATGRPGHDLFGKIAGAIIGNFAKEYARDYIRQVCLDAGFSEQEADALAGAALMETFLLGWFIAIHAGQFINEHIGRVENALSGVDNAAMSLLGLGPRPDIEDVSYEESSFSES
jgi:hypothetical protein